MEQLWFYLISFSSLLILLLIPNILLKKNKKFPPSPPSIPIIGHLHLIKEPVHKVLLNLSHKYGPVFALKFGSRPVIVISSASALEECFTNNDVTLSNRPRLIMGKTLGYNYTNVGSVPYGPFWRELRKVTMLELLSTNKLNACLNIRQEEVKYLVKNLFKVSSSNKEFTKVEMKSKISEIPFNVVMRMLSGKRYFGDTVENLDEAKKFQDLFKEVFELSGASNPGDFLPFLRWIDFQNMEKRLSILHRKFDLFLQGLVDELRSNRRVSGTNEGKTNTLIDVMLSLQDSKPESYTDDLIKSNMVTLLLAGTDTSSVTLEWAMSLMLNHPKVLKKARIELDSCVGKDKLVNESDLPNLFYIQSIISETLRLYPAAPLLVPRESSEDCTIGGFHVPQGTMLLTNAWAIHRDPLTWDDPTSFSPERFMGREVEAYKLAPFGMGRRICPGIGLANRVMGLTLSTLIQCFDWERISEEMVDLTPGRGLTMPKDKPLEAMCRAREEMLGVLSKL